MFRKGVGGQLQRDHRSVEARRPSPHRVAAVRAPAVDQHLCRAATIPLPRVAVLVRIKPAPPRRTAAVLVRTKPAPPRRTAAVLVRTKPAPRRRTAAVPGRPKLAAPHTKLAALHRTAASLGRAVGPRRRRATVGSRTPAPAPRPATRRTIRRGAGSTTRTRRTVLMLFREISRVRCSVLGRVELHAPLSGLLCTCVPPTAARITATRVRPISMCGLIRMLGIMSRDTTNIGRTTPAGMSIHISVISTRRASSFGSRLP